MKNFKKLLKITFAVTFSSLIISYLPALATNKATLSGIKVKSVANNYQVILKTDKDIDIKKFVTAQNKVVLDLNNVEPAQFINTIYQDAPNINHLIVKPVSDSKIRIFIQGENMAASKIILDTRDEALSLLGGDTPLTAEPESVQKFVTKSHEEPAVIDLSDRIINENSIPTINLEDKDKNNIITPIIEYKNQSKENYSSIKNSMGLNSTINDVFNVSIFDWVLRFLMIGIIITGSLKAFAKPKNVKIDLTSTREREIDLYRSVNNKKELITKSIGSSINTNKQTKAKTYGSLSQYGLKEYQNSQKPPARMSQTTDIKNLHPENSTKLKSALKSYGNTKRQTISQRTAPQLSKKHQEEAQTNFDGVKFLETMAQIYEKNGQAELAKGIQKNLSRNNRIAG